MRKQVWLVAIAGGVLLASGCRTLTGGSCHKPQAYEQVEDLPPLKIPAGLDGPDTAGALEIPELNAPEIPADPDGPCLDAPPALTAPPPPPSEVVLPPPPERGTSAPAGPRASGSSESDEADEPDTRRRRPPRRPR